MGKIRDNVRRNLGYYLSLRGISQKKLSEMLGVSQSAVTNWMKGKNSPDIEMVNQICKVLDISVLELFGTDTNVELSQMEREVLLQYRRKKELQHAVNILLGLERNDKI